MKVAILGAGAAAFALAVLLRRDGHDPVIWSPSGRSAVEIASGRPIRATGVIEGDYSVRTTPDCASAMDRAEVVILALPAMGHRMVMEAMADHLCEEQTVIISAHLSFGALFLDRLLAARGVTIPIVAWSTTLLRARQPDLATSRIATLRKTVDIAVLPAHLAQDGLATCQALFGDRFNLRSDILAVSLSNVNPQGHMALALCNFTRMELGETWDQNQCSTTAIGNLLDKIDAERMALAETFDVVVRSAQEHKLHTHGVGGAASAKLPTYGPATIETRYTLEDVPFGLVPSTILGRLTGTPMPLHEAGIRIFSALYDRDLAAANDLSEGLLVGTPGSFHQLCRDGFERSKNLEPLWQKSS